jgi:hypothetical protein
MLKTTKCLIKAQSHISIKSVSFSLFSFAITNMEQRHADIHNGTLMSQKCRRLRLIRTEESHRSDHGQI